MQQEKYKCWVAYDDEWPGGLVFDRRDDALEYSRELRWELGPGKCYVRVKYFTQEELDEMIEP